MKATFIGAGNVATHFAKAFAKCGITIDTIYSRNILNAKTLATIVDTKATDNLEFIGNDSDIYVISVSDNAIQSVAEAISKKRGIVVHTSGATSIDALQKHERRGVLYPCMSFTKSVDFDFRTTPLLIEAADDKTCDILMDIAHKISDAKIMYATSEQRRKLHVAAVIASNFTNHLLHLADKYITRNGLDFELLKPLVRQTIEKALATNPFDAQTGPARRHDTNTIERHLELIGDDESLANIYNTLTNSIINSYK
ncbi:MAG: DUF2520 domain-containing protein [Bacteroidales bacterium]|nr:DUF2520 domain-containing protein [Bacteroidales bacterium]